MVDLDDTELERTQVEPPSQSSRLPWVALAVFLLMAGAAVWYLFLREPDGSAVQVETETARAASPAAPDTTAAEPGDDIPLPPLDESDSLVRELVARLSSHPRVAAWLTTDHLIRNFTVVVLNIAQGQSPSVHLKGVAPVGSFQVREEGNGIVIDPASYSRYDSYADAVAGLDARGTARLYATLRPRIDEAYAQLGAPDGDFTRTLQRAIVALLQTPTPAGPVRLNGDSVSYTYADPKLESLSAAQRQFMRMGPRNMRLVKAKLREIAGYIGIPASALPPPESTN
jgi:hypothetical protein